jgi:hypothetical protein
MDLFVAFLIVGVIGIVFWTLGREYQKAIYDETDATKAEVNKLTRDWHGTK